MASHRLSPEAQRKLANLLADARLGGDRILEELRRIRDGEGAPAFAATVEALARVRLADREAEAALMAILRHREQLHSSLGRDPGLQVAAEDYFTNPEGGLPAASVDPESGWVGPDVFRNELRRELRRSLRHGLEFAVLRIDVGAVFRRLEPGGAPDRDGTFRAVARVLRRTLRDADRAARLSDNEIAVVLIGTDRIGAQAAAERVLESIAFTIGGSAESESARAACLPAGIACFPADGQSVEALEARADDALRRARRGSGIRVEAHHAERRGHPRSPAAAGFTVELRAAGERTGGEPGNVVNLSRSGALVRVRGHHRPQERFGLVFAPFREASPSARWTAGGRVVRVQSGATPEDGQLLGIEFDELLPEERLVGTSGAPGAPPGSRLAR